MEAEEFFAWYKKQKTIKEELAILEDYIENSDDFKMDCTPIPLTKINNNK